MNLRGSYWLIYWVMLCCLLTSTIRAQDDSSDPTNGPLKDILSSDGVLNGEYRLEVLGDNLEPVLSDVTLQELRQLKSLANANQQMPMAIFTSVEVEATIAGDLASISGIVEVQLGANQGPARIDLGFDNCRLTEMPSLLRGQGRSGVRSNGNGGYQWLMLADENERCAIQLNAKTKVAQNSDRNVLSINLPPAESVVSVLLPATATDLSVRSEDILTTTTVAEGIRALVNSRGGEFTLSWRKQGAVDRISAIEAESTTTFEITDPREPWIASTDLTVRWFGSDSSNSFEIQLPKGASWYSDPFPLDSSRFEISVVTSEEPTKVPEDTQFHSAERIRVQMLGSARSDSVSIPLRWEWTPPQHENPNAEIEVPVASVHGVDQHRGQLELVFPSEYSATFKEGGGARLGHQGRLAGVYRQQQLRFYFDREDFELAMAFRSEQSLPTVRPTYKVDVDQSKLVLTAWFNCSFYSGALPVELTLLPGDWILEENTARALRNPQDPFSADSDVLNVRRQEDGSYVITGREPDGDFGNSRRIEQVWRIVAERRWNPDDNHALEFKVPEIVRGRRGGVIEADHSSGVLLVASANNVLTQWNETASTGLLPDSFSSDYQKFVGEMKVREPLAYRFQSRGTTPNWAGRADFLPQQISFEHRCDIQIVSSSNASKPSEPPVTAQPNLAPNFSDSSFLLQQSYMLQIANKPLSDLQFAVHESAEVTQVFVNGNLTTVKPLGALPTQALQSDALPVETNGQPAITPWRLYQLEGAPNLLGAAQVSILTTVPIRTTIVGATEAPASNGGRTTPDTNGSQILSDNEPHRPADTVRVPVAHMMLPEGARSIRQDWDFVDDSRFEVIASSTGQSPENLSLRDKRLDLPEDQLSIEFKFRPREHQTVAPIIVRGCMLQSITTGDKRRDRFMARIECTTGTIDISLPRAGELEAVPVAVDGVALKDASYDYSSKTLSISMPTSETPQEHVIELFYGVDETLSWITAINMERPRIAGAEYQGKFYWQLVMPSDQHLGWCPNGLTAEWHWQWSGMWWYRQSGQDQASLERWLGGSVQARLPLSANSYVMSAQTAADVQSSSLLENSAQAPKVWVMSRFVLWFPLGLAAIVLAMLTLSFPTLRSPVTALGLAAVVGGLALVWPDMAILLGQTAVLSLSLVLLILITQAAIDARVRRRSVFTTRPSTYLEGGSDHFSLKRGVRASNSTTAVHGGSSVVAAGEK
ncbi:MAG: hypothetical protein R3C53_04235 [Pirellulaceae bacterium]